MTLLILAIVIGGAFGFVLDRVGATNPGLIIRMLNLSNMHLMKTILLAIGLSSVLMFAGLLAGLIDVGHMDVKTAYVGVFVGGLLLGAGFAVSGFCPGTGLTAAATGRKDALAPIWAASLGSARPVCWKRLPVATARSAPSPALKGRQCSPACPASGSAFW